MTCGKHISWVRSIHYTTASKSALKPSWRELCPHPRWQRRRQRVNVSSFCRHAKLKQRSFKIGKVRVTSLFLIISGEANDSAAQGIELLLLISLTGVWPLAFPSFQKYGIMFFLLFSLNLPTCLTPKPLFTWAHSQFHCTDFLEEQKIPKELELLIDLTIGVEEGNLAFIVLKFVLKNFNFKFALGHFKVYI